MNIATVVPTSVGRSARAEQSRRTHRRDVLVSVVSTALAGVGVLAVLLSGAWPAAAQVAEPSGATVDYPRDPDTVVVRYAERIGGIANPDTPSLTIYGDGRAVVHYPDYTKRAGDYEVRLTRDEMDRLLRSIVEKGVLTFDPDAVRRAKRESLAARRSAALAQGVEPETVTVLDDSTTGLEVRVDRVTSGAAGERSVAPVHKTITWHGLGTDAWQHPEIEPIRNLAEVAKDLRALLKRPNLDRIN